MERIDENEDLSYEDLVRLVTKHAKENVVSVMKGFHHCGYDLEMKSLGSLHCAEESFTSWTWEEDLSLMDYLNDLLARFNPIHLGSLNTAGHEFSKKSESEPLKDKSEKDIRSRICLILGSVIN